MKKEIAASVLDEEEPTRSLEISSAADLDKKKSSLGAFLTRVKIFLLKRKKYDVQTLVWIRYLPFYIYFIKKLMCNMDMFLISLKEPSAINCS